MIGSVYFREHLLDGDFHAEPTTDDRFITGPAVTMFMFAGGRKLRLPRNLGPHSNDAVYTAALADAEGEGIGILQSPEVRTHEDLDEDVAEDAPEILEVLEELQKVRAMPFPSALEYLRVHSH